MYAGVPDVTWSAERRVLRAPPSAEPHQSKVEHFHEVVVEPHAADVHVRGLDVAVHEAPRVRFSKRVADLPQQVRDAICRQRAEVADQRLEVASDQQLHHVVERPIVGEAEVEQIDRVGRIEDSSRLRLSLESAQHGTGILLARQAQHFRTHELDRRRPHKQPMLGAPYLAHSSVAELLHQLVAAQLACVGDSAPHAMQRDRWQHGDDGAEVVRVVQEDRLGKAGSRQSTHVRNAHRERIHRRGHEARGEHLERGRWHHHRVHEDQDRVPGHISRVRERRHPLIDDGDGERVEDEQPQPKIERGFTFLASP